MGGTTADESWLESAFITLVDADPGHEAAYDEWYGGEHLYVGGMALPYWFAGRRWIATPPLKAQRRWQPPSVVESPHDGTFLATYWILRGGFTEQLHALRRTVDELLASSRMFARRRHVHSLFYDRVAAVRGPRPGPRDFQALDVDLPGMVLEFIDVDAPADRPALLAELPAALAEALQPEGLDSAIVFTPRHWPPDVELWFDYGPVADTRTLVVWLLSAEPDAVSDHFDRDEHPLGTQGRSTFIAPFRPLRPGDSHVA